MASTLASQLQALAVAKGAAPVSKQFTYPSLLYSPSQAANIDLHTIFVLAQTGFNDLVTKDGRFKTFEKRLFSLESSQINRELQSKVFNEKLDKSIAGFLQVLTSYVMLNSAHQVLEYMMRRHKVYVYNVEDVVLCVLPYHETSLFVRLVQLLQIKNTRWQFLETVQNTGATLPRAVLVQRCINDMATLESVCELGMSVSGLASKSKTSISFTSVVLVETLAEIPSVSTEVVNKVLPYVLRSFEGGVAEEYRVGALMIIGALGNRTALAPSLIETFFHLISRAFQKSSESEGSSLLQLYIMVLIQLVQTQKIDVFPSKSFKTFVKARELLPTLIDLDKMFDLQKFSALLVQALAEHCFQHEHYERAFMEVVNTLPVENEIIPSVVRLLDLSFGNTSKKEDEGEGSKSRGILKRILQALEKRFPAQVDKAIAIRFERLDQREGEVQKDPAFIFITDVFRSSLRVPLEETRMSLYLSLDHPQASIRESALKQLSTMASTLDEEEGAEVYTVLREAYLRRLSDENYHIVETVLSADNFVKIIPAERIFQALASIISKCRTKFIKGEKASLADVENVSRRAIDILTSDFLQQHPKYTDKVAVLLFEYLLQRPLTWKLNSMILKAAGTIPFDLYADFGKIYGETVLRKEDGTRTKEKRILWLAEVNGKIVRALAAKVSTDFSAWVANFLKAPLNSGAKLLVILVQLQCFRQNSEGLSAHLLDRSLQWLKSEWTAANSDRKIPLGEFEKMDHSGWDDLSSAPPKFYTQLEVDSSAALVGLLLRALYDMIGCMPAITKGDDVHLGRYKTVFALFAGCPTTKIFKSHLDLLLSRLPEAEIFPFICNFFITEDGAGPAYLHVHSLDVLASRLQSMIPKSNMVEHTGYERLQFLAPPLVVALGSSLQAIRRSGIRCVEVLCALWKKKSAGSKTLDLPLAPAWFMNFVTILAEKQAAIIASEVYLWELIAEKYNPDASSGDIELKDKDETESVLMFLTGNALRLPVYGQRVVLDAICGMARGAELVRATHKKLKKLVQRRNVAHLGKEARAEHEKLSEAEVHLLQALIKMYTPSVPAEVRGSASSDEEDVLSTFFDVLQVEGGSLEDVAVSQPSLAAVKCLTSSFYDELPTTWQDTTFQVLLSFSTASDENFRSASREALKNIKISSMTVSRHLDCVAGNGLSAGSHERKRKKRKTIEEKAMLDGNWPAKNKLLYSTASILELLLWKTDMDKRDVLLSPLFKLLRGIIGGVWPQLEKGDNREENSTHSTAVLHAQHLILMVLDNVIRTFADAGDQKEWAIHEKFDFETVIKAVSEAKDGVTRNHALALLTSLGKLIPEAVLRHILDILTVVGNSILSEDDSYSHHVVHQLLVAIVPGWLTAEHDPIAVLQIFVSTLPRMQEHRRLAVITNLLRITTEKVGLHLFIFLLLQRSRRENGVPQTAASNGFPDELSEPVGSLELEFAVALCRQYAISTRLPAMVKLLDVAKVGQRQPDWHLQQLATQFVADQVQNSELLFGGQLIPNSDSLQPSFVNIMERTLHQLTTVKANQLPAALEKASRDSALSVLDGLALVMPPVDYLQGLSSLMKHSNADTRRRVLRMYIGKLKSLDRYSQPEQSRRKRGVSAAREAFSLSKPSEEWKVLRVQIVKDITDLISGAQDKSISSELAAIEALKVSAEKFAEDVPEMFVLSLSALLRYVKVTFGERCSVAIQGVTTVIDKLGPRALPALPETAAALFDIAEKVISSADNIAQSKEKHLNPRSELPGLILAAVEALLNKLGAFLTPYLQNILDVVVLRPKLLAGANSDTLAKAETLRALIPGKISARLLLDPLLSLHESAIGTSDDAACALFDTLATLVATADRSFLAAHHAKIFEFCLTALDLRSRRLSTLQSIARVEAAVISVIVALVMKLNETAFKPLFVRVLEWAESDAEVEGMDGSRGVDRSIVFHKLVNQLIAKLRSVFVPYLQYMMNGCVRHLTKRPSNPDAPKPMKKKKRLNIDEDKDAALSALEWYLRQLVLSYLHQTFLYDNVGFLDSTRFQTLLMPIVSQLTAEAPSSVPALKKDARGSEIPSVEEVDGVLVDCLGQMALAAGTDLLWKPLNHEVLMSTRVESSRTRLLGLRVAKFLAEHLKEEYLVLVPETIPFLAELLEDSDLTVVAKTQEVIKTLEDLSGEDLTQYF